MRSTGTSTALPGGWAACRSRRRAMRWTTEACCTEMAQSFHQSASRSAVAWLVPDTSCRACITLSLPPLPPAKRPPPMTAAPFPLRRTMKSTIGPAALGWLSHFVSQPSGEHAHAFYVTPSFWPSPPNPCPRKGIQPHTCTCSSM